jgi:curli biogenesis system outer membrane secretion channel CsgG
MLPVRNSGERFPAQGETDMKYDGQQHSLSILSKRSVVFAGVALLAATSLAGAEIKKSIAVAPIGSSAGTVGWISGEAIHAQLITELDKTGRYRVVERENLGGVLKEQDLAAEGRMRKGSGAETGNLEGAQLMIKGTITDAEEESGKGGSGGFKGISLGGKKTIYRVTMDFRIYDMTTGIILGTETASAEQVKKGKSGGVGIGGLRLGGNKSEGDTTGAIVRDLIKQALAGLDKHSKIMGWKSNVLSVKKGKAVILGGLRDGLEKGMKFKLFKLGEQIVDDDTGEVLDEGEETEVGEIELVQVKEKISFATKTSGEEPEKGFVVRLIQKD